VVFATLPASNSCAADRGIIRGFDSISQKPSVRYALEIVIHHSMQADLPQQTESTTPR